MNTVSVKSIDGKTKVDIKPFKMSIEFNEKTLEITLGNALTNRILLKGDTQFLCDGDFHFVSTGEFGIITKKAPIHLDSIDSKVHINSRLSKPIKNSEQSITKREEYKLLQENSIKEANTIHTLKEKAENDFLLYVESLETRISKLEKLCLE